MKTELLKPWSIRAIITCLAVSCLALPRAWADASLALPLYGQERNNWCWDASCQMVLDFYGFTATQTGIATWAVAGADIGNDLDADYPNRKGCKQVLKHFGPVASERQLSALTKSQVRAEMDRSHPAILGIFWNGGGGHAVVLRGYADIGDDLWVSINDPWPQSGKPSINDPDTGSAALVLYEAVASGPNNSANNYRANMYPTQSGTAAVGNRWGQTLKTSKSLDIAFVIDTTGSMSDDIGQVKINAASFISKLSETYSDLRIAVQDYKDYPVSPYGNAGDYIARTDAVFTTNAATAVAAINALTVSGGNDTPEAVYSALIYALDGSALGGWRDDESVTKRIIILGDAPGHDPEPWAGGYSYLDVLSQAILKGIRIDAIISGGGSADAAALASLGTVAFGSGGSSYPAGISQIANALSQISSNLTEEVRSPHGTNTAIRPVFAFGNLPATLMNSPVRSRYLEVQSQKAGDTNWFRYKKVSVRRTTYQSPTSFPTNNYRWRLGYQSSPSSFQLPNGEKSRTPGGSFAEDSWTGFTRSFSAPGTPVLLSPGYYFNATNSRVTYSFTKAANADSYALRIFRGFTPSPTNLFKTLTVKPTRGTNAALRVVVSGHKPGVAYHWQVQALNFDRKKPDTNSWTF